MIHCELDATLRPTRALDLHCRFSGLRNIQEANNKLPATRTVAAEAVRADETPFSASNGGGKTRASSSARPGAEQHQSLWRRALVPEYVLRINRVSLMRFYK